MPFPIDPFPAAIARALHNRGFIRTSQTILRLIADGKLQEELDGLPPQPYSAFEQQQICADVIENNIIFAYAAWEACSLELGNEDLIPATLHGEVELESLLMVTALDGGVRPLGSFQYREPIENLRKTVDRLRGMEPPAPEGGTPPSGPRDGSGGQSRTRSHDMGSEQFWSDPQMDWFDDDRETKSSVNRSFDERLPFSKIVPLLSSSKRWTTAKSDQSDEARNEEEKQKQENKNGFPF